MRLNWTLTWLCVATLAGCGGGGNDPESLKKRLEQACVAVCEKAYNPSCQGIDLDQCKAGCPLLDDQLGEACLAEYADFYECASGTVYECGELGPQPVAGNTCLSETFAVQECSQSAPCKTYCSKKSDCDGSDAASCESECSALLEESSCDYRYEDLLDCQGQGGLVCESGKLGTVGCVEEVQDYAVCLADNGDVCSGFCAASELVACGAGTQATCETACAAEADDASAKGCGDQHQQLRSCQLGHGVPCKDGEPTIVGCSEEAYFYQTCLEGK